MTDNELIELRKKVKEKQEQEKIEKEKRELKEKLNEGSIKQTAKKIGKDLFKRLMK